MLLFAGDDDQEASQAIDILSVSNAFTLSIRRILSYHVSEIGNADRTIREVSQPLASAPFHLLRGRGLALLQLPADLQPSCNIAEYLSVSYEMVVTVHDVTGYQGLPVDVDVAGDGLGRTLERDVFKRAVKIMTNQADRPPDYYT